jgi:hypothetical protein
VTREVSSPFVPGCLSQRSCDASVCLTRLSNFASLVPSNLELTRMLPPKPRTFRESVFVCSYYYLIYHISPLYLSVWFIPVYDLYSLQ